MQLINNINTHNLVLIVILFELFFTSDLLHARRSLVGYNIVITQGSTTKCLGKYLDCEPAAGQTTVQWDPKSNQPQLRFAIGKKIIYTKYLCLKRGVCSDILINYIKLLCNWKQYISHIRPDMHCLRVLHGTAMLSTLKCSIEVCVCTFKLVNGCPDISIPIKCIIHIVLQIQIVFESIYEPYELNILCYNSFI